MLFVTRTYWGYAMPMCTIGTANSLDALSRSRTIQLVVREAALVVMLMVMVLTKL